MKHLILTIEIPEDYEDAHPDIIINDMRISDYWNIVEREVRDWNGKVEQGGD